MVGCFKERSLDQEGFLWSETRYDFLNQQSIEEILALPQTLMLCRATEQGLETWAIGPDDELAHSGLLEVKGRGYASIGQLLALR
ncbi:MAG: hypothetical protein RTU92_10790 [Candidatus Thorarchaeota archaeon]